MMTLRALIVDDHRDVADSLAVLLQTLGATARAVYDGPCGLAAMLEFKPDIVFIDIRMSGMDGYETARRIREGGHAHRFILVALTGWSRSDDPQRAQAAGFDAYLTKPAPIDAIKALLRLARP